ncbi:carboxypeptidase M32 [Lachnoclostridium edouardi]|uniref:carboxypeptidase M32 n=1 Tax=Lachnoclostridium edouardi TaxID=1926283 RepID=UPI000C7A8CC8|nr:carboxypeptidase M32 [Lachnoclostridium edouardi]
MNRKFHQLEEILDRAGAIYAAQNLFQWDNETLAPKEAGENTGKTVGILAGMYYEIMAGEDLGKLIEECRQQADLDWICLCTLKEAEKERRLISSIPRKDYEEYTKLISQAGRIWAKAKSKKDFSMFAPVLETILDYKIKMARLNAEKGREPYDVLLAGFDDSFLQKELDEFFYTVKKELVPFLREIREKGRKIDNCFLQGDYSEEGQEKLARFLAEYIGFDFDKGVLAVSPHPFTTSLHNKDVRITTHYDNRVDHSAFSVIHEGGHGLYEMGIDDKLTQTILGQGASMAMHESQSRFMENCIGRSKAFWKPIYGKVQEIFPKELGNISLNQFIEGINKVEPGFIRINADELTYSLHILVRYELEKDLIGGKLSVKDLEQAWADKYKAYLGVEPKDAAEGVLQDIHWSQGSLGYFPSYALGSAFAAQIYWAMREKMDIDRLLEKGDLKTIREYLRENIHSYGKTKDSLSLMRQATGREFSPDFYIKYLKEKYSQLYLES